MVQDEKRRCSWVSGSNPLLVSYHDHEWGRPCRDDRRLFEMLMLEMFQAGLSWECILNKRENFRRAFDGFDPAAVSRYDEEKLTALCADPGIVRHRQKLRAVISNAGVYEKLCREQGGFAPYLDRLQQDDPASALPQALASDLKSRGMKFIGPSVAESFLQAIGMVDSHEPGCFLARIPAEEK